MHTITAIAVTITAVLIIALAMTGDSTPSIDALMIDCLNAGLSVQECREGIL